MSERQAKRLRREARERGDAIKPKQLFKPLMLTIKGNEVYIPRRQRRALMRSFLTDLRKGRIDMSQLNQEDLA